MGWNPGDLPPPWEPPAGKAKFEKYKWEMIDFASWHLFGPDFPDPPPVMKDVPYPEEFMEVIPSALYDAGRGDIEPLRRAFPQLAEFLHLPPEKKRDHGVRVTGGYDLHWRAKGAAKAVPRIRALWEQTYEKSKRRLPPLVEQIAAEMFSVKVEDVELWLSRDKAEKHKQKPKNIRKREGKKSRRHKH